MLAASLTLSVPTALSQETGFRFSGYGLTIPGYQESGGGMLGPAGDPSGGFFDLSRLRLRPSFRFGPNTLLVLEHETELILGRAVRIGEVSDARLSRQIEDLHWTPLSGADGGVAHYVDRLFLRQQVGTLTLTIGRQRIAWGTGRVWNPTDLFNPVNPADYSRLEKRGADALSVKYYQGDFTDFELIVNPEDRFNRTNVAARARMNAAEIDFSVMGGRFGDRTVVGGDFAGNAFGSGVRGELLFAIGDGEEDVVTFILGADYQFTPKLYGLVEYLYNGNGSTDTSSYDFSSLASGWILQVGRDYLHGTMTYLVHPVVTVLGAVNVNLNDRSGYVTPQVTWAALSNLDVSLGALAVWGAEHSEYAYYNGSIFGKLTVYF